MQTTQSPRNREAEAAPFEFAGQRVLNFQRYIGGPADRLEFDRIGDDVEKHLLQFEVATFNFRALSRNISRQGDPAIARHAGQKAQRKARELAKIDRRSVEFMA